VDTNNLAAGSWWKNPGSKAIVYDRIVKDNATGKPFMVYNLVALPKASEQPSTAKSTKNSKPNGFREARPAGSADGTFAANTNKSKIKAADVSLKSISGDKTKATETGSFNVDKVAVEILATGTNQSTGLSRP
jgi:hypothetical protein